MLSALLHKWREGNSFHQPCVTAGTHAYLGPAEYRVANWWSCSDALIRKSLPINGLIWQTMAFDHINQSVIRRMASTVRFI
ncbi:hypothetical protein D1823_13265 [Ruegeria sp. AD91A]|nr:hypothetical protein D1823_13265 [Ruegeria sp. AD91A]